jgi:hypothetical protein
MQQEFRELAVHEPFSSPRPRANRYASKPNLRLTTAAIKHRARINRFAGWALLRVAQTQVPRPSSDFDHLFQRTNHPVRNKAISERTICCAEVCRFRHYPSISLCSHFHVLISRRAILAAPRLFGTRSERIHQRTGGRPSGVRLRAIQKRDHKNSSRSLGLR